MIIKRLTLMGFGMMGASVAAAIKTRALPIHIHAIDTQPEALDIGLKKSWVDTVAESCDTNAVAADLILIATPLNAIPKVLQDLACQLTRTQEMPLIHDLGSVKQSVIAAAEQILDASQLSRFIPGHPIAGSEKAGPIAANPALFQNRSVILTPLALNATTDLAQIEQFWQQLGANVMQMSAELHDQRLAMTSHLPHALALTYLKNLYQRPDVNDYLAVTGGGFEDFTRIGRIESTNVWQAIFQQNKTALCQEIQNLQADLQQLQQALENDDVEALQQFLQHKTCRGKDE